MSSSRCWAARPAAHGLRCWRFNFGFGKDRCQMLLSESHGAFTELEVGPCPRAGFGPYGGGPQLEDFGQLSDGVDAWRGFF